MRRADNIVFAYITFRIKSFSMRIQHGLARAAERKIRADKRPHGGLAYLNCAGARAMAPKCLYPPGRVGFVGPTRPNSLALRSDYEPVARPRLGGLWYALVCCRGRPCPEFTSDTPQAFGVLPSLRPWRCAWAPCTQASTGTTQAAPKTHAQSPCSPIQGVLQKALRPLPGGKLPIRQRLLRSGRCFPPHGRAPPTGPERLPSADRQIYLNRAASADVACGICDSGVG